MGRNNADFRIAFTKEYWQENMKKEQDNKKNAQAHTDDNDPHGVYNRDLDADRMHSRAADAEIGDY